jgi:outer membrane protein TolC
MAVADGGVEGSESAIKALVDIVSKSAVVETYRNEILVADWKVKQQQAADSPQISFTTAGKFPIADTVNESANRVSDVDRRYLDGIFQVSKPLYDWGKNEALIQANKLRRQSSVYKFQMVHEEEMAKLLSLSVDYLRIVGELDMLNRDVAFLSQTLVSVRKRFEAGAGSLEDVRRLELKRLDLERDLERAKNAQQQSAETIRKRFSVDVTEIEDVVMALLSVIPKPQDITIEGSSLMASRSSELEQKALDYEIASVLGEKRPAVTGTLTSRLFNIVTDPLDEYEIYGGLNVEFPVFDGGARDARVAGLNTQKVIVRSRLREELDRVDERWYELSAEFENTVSMLEQDERRLSTLRDRLDALKKRLEAVQVTINDLAEAELARTQAVRSIQSMEWSLLKIAVQKADAADKLYADLNVELPL